MKRCTLFILLSLLSLWGITIFAQVTIGSLTPPDESAVLQVISPDDDKGVLIPKLSQKQRDEIANPAHGLMIFNTSENCYNYYDAVNHEWTSLCGGAANAVGIVECQSIALSGTLIQGTPAHSGNYLTVPVKVTKAGVYYAITAMPEPANGYYFTASGSFPAPGNYYVNLFANGVPTNATSTGDAIVLTFNGEQAGCTGLRVPVSAADPDYTITNVTVVPALFPVGTNLSPEDHYLSVTLNVKNPGQWQLVSNIVNGYQFSANGNISQASGYNPSGSFPQTVTVTVPVTGGQAGNYSPTGDNFTLSNSGSKTSSTYPFNVRLANVGFTVNCPSAIIDDKGNPFKQNEHLIDQEISLQITVTSPGTTRIYATGAGIVFDSQELNLTAGTQTIILYADPSSMPIASGSKVLMVSSDYSGARVRDVCTIPVNILPATADFNDIWFASTTPNTANYVVDVNKDIPIDYVTISVVVSKAGEYHFVTDTINGVSYERSGTLIASASPQDIRLYPKGDAVGVVGTKTYTLKYPGGAPVMNNGNPITFDIHYVYRAMNILVVGSNSYYDLTNVKRFINTSTKSVSYPEGDKNFGSKGKVPTAGVTLTTYHEKKGGSADRKGILVDLLDPNYYDIVLIGYNNNQWNEEDVAAMVNYVKKRGVLFVATEGYNNAYNATNTIRDVIKQVFDMTSTINYNSPGDLWYTGSITMGAYVAETTTGDPILDGKFGPIMGEYLGNDVSTTSNVLVGKLPAGAISLARPHSGATNTSGYYPNVWYSIRHDDLAFVWAGDSGFWGAWYHSEPTASGRGTSPINCSPTQGSPLEPQRWTPAMSGSGVTGTIDVENGRFLMNFLGYGIEYAGTHKHE